MRKSFLRMRDFDNTYSDENSIPIPKGLIRKLSMDEIIFFMTLVKSQIHKDYEEKNEGWGPISVGTLTNLLAIKPSKQSRLMASLEKKNFLRRKFKGCPPVRLIWLDFDKLENTLLPWQEFSDSM